MPPTHGAHPRPHGPRPAWSLVTPIRPRHHHTGNRAAIAVAVSVVALVVAFLMVVLLT